ncbi:MAG: hypothetical protein EBU32_03625, partial [Opitutaceae bacterium]|nr:hypothetical protein [Opitutaceae bacterium]
FRHVEKTTATLPQHFTVRRVHRVKIPPQLAHHTRRLQPSRPVRGKREGQGIVPAEFSECHTRILIERSRPKPARSEKF